MNRKKMLPLVVLAAGVVVLAVVLAVLKFSQTGQETVASLPRRLIASLTAVTTRRLPC